jgi:C4-dicarboxylate-specific signal transduction histidine kinase
MRDPAQLPGDVEEHAALDDRIALLSVLQELTVAVLKLFDPASPLDDFLEKITARLGCAVTLCAAVRAPGQPLTLLGSSGLARSSRALPLPALPAGGVEDALLPYPELQRHLSNRWAVRVPGEDETSSTTWLLLWFEREPRSPLQYRGVLQRVAHDLGLALSHREMVARVVESERELQRLNAELERRVEDRTRALASANAELRRRERALRTLGACNEALVRAGDEQALLDAVCRLVVEIGGYAACWVGLAEGDRRDTVRPAARASREEAPAADLVRAEVERADGATRRAIRTGLPSPVGGDPSSERGAASILALPLAADGVTLGALAIHASEPGAFDPDELKLLAELAANTGFGIGALRARAQQLRMTAQLVQADRLAGLGTLAAGIAHEINNPLAYVIAGLQFLSDRVADIKAGHAPNLEEARLTLRDVCEGADRIRKIVRDLKAFSRGDDESRRLVDLRPVLRSATEIAQSEARHRARVLEEYGATPRVLASESRLGQVFLNLLINAAHSIPEGAVDDNQIHIRTSTDEEGRALVEIRDTGCGMAPETVRRVFEPFFTTKPVGVGTGLGLWICHDFVTQLGGTIEAESAPGKGSVFRVRLPAARSEAEPEVPGPGPAEPPSLRGRILVVDDEPQVGVAVRRALAPEHEVLLTTRAAEARRRIALGERFDVILCDLMMPGLTGMDLHADLLRRAPDQAERMIFITGGAVTSQARRFLSASPNPLLEKPFAAAELRAFVNRLLAEKGPRAKRLER